jgi:hypothetical protein
MAVVVLPQGDRSRVRTLRCRMILTTYEDRIKESALGGPEDGDDSCKATSNEPDVFINTIND